MTDFDVIISGYGPTGAVAANLLGQRGVRVLVVEPSRAVYDIPRAVHFDGEVMRIFQSLGLAEAIEAVSGTASHLAFVNAWGWTLRSADVSEAPRTQGWPVGNFFNQPLLEERLRGGAARFETVEVRLGARLDGFAQDDEGVDARISRLDVGGAATGVETVRARYLLGCDGAGSPTRREAGIELEDLHCHEPWLVCDLILDDDVDFRRDALQICDPRRPTTLVPCEGQHVRWEFMQMPGDDPARLEDPETARAMMAPHMHHLAPGLTADRGRLIRGKVYTFHSLVAHDFRAGRAFLLGDAAHQTPPFLGQGMCAGIRDAYNLCWKLHGVLEGRFRDDLLDSYTSERRSHAMRVVRDAVRAGAIIQTRSRSRALLRDAFLLFGRLFPRLAPEVGWAPRWSLGPGLWEDAEAPSWESAHGHPIDQPEIRTAAGQSVRLDELLGDGFAVLGLGVAPKTLLDDSGRAAAQRLEVRCLHVSSDEDGDVADGTGALADWSARYGPARVVILRPDRQVYGVYDAASDAALGARLSAALVSLDERVSGEGLSSAS